MKKELIKLLKEKYKNHNSIRFSDGKVWNIDIYNKDTRINIKIEDSNVNCCMVDSRDNDDFYEFYIYKGFSDDLRQNKYIRSIYSQSLLDYDAAINVVNDILINNSY